MSRKRTKPVDKPKEIIVNKENLIKYGYKCPENKKKKDNCWDIKRIVKEKPSTRIVREFFKFMANDIKDPDDALFD